MNTSTDKDRELLENLVLEDRPAADSTEVGPHSPCPCGSGRKFRLCCRTEATV